MIFLDIHNVKPGMILGKPIYVGNQPMLTENTILNNRYLKRLEDLGIHGIYITNDAVDNIEINDIISQKTKTYAFELAQKTLTMVEKPEDFTPVMGKKIKNLVNNMIEEILSCKELLLNLYNIKTFDDYIFNHSVNVCLYSLIIGIAINYPIKKLEQLGIGAFLHDLGKMQVTSKILNKPDRLTEDEFEEIKKHPSFGYNILIKSREIDFTSAHIAYQHHEKLNGNGYPRKLDNENIHQFAKITAIADIYDAITSNRVYKKAMPNSQAVEIIMASASTELDPELVKIFLRHVPIYPKGSLVVLNNKSKGVVTKPNQDLPLRPKIRIIEEEGRKVTPYEINLAQKLELTIINTTDL